MFRSLSGDEQDDAVYNRMVQGEPAPSFVNVNSQLSDEGKDSVEGIIDIWDNLSKVDGIHDEEDLKEIDALVDDLARLIRELTKNQNFE